MSTSTEATSTINLSRNLSTKENREFWEHVEKVSKEVSLPDVDMSKWDKRFLSLAHYISTWSKDPSTQVGTVITDSQNRVISIGYNGLARGVQDTEERLHNRDLKYRMIVHGEMNAILFANKDLTGCTLYTWPFMPCARCAAMVIQSGIKRVVTLKNDNPRWQEDFLLTREMFKEAGVTLEEFV